MEDIKNMPVIFTQVGTKEKKGEDMKKEIETGLMLYGRKAWIKERISNKNIINDI